jgi:hypothetical protein
MLFYLDQKGERHEKRGHRGRILEPQPPRYFGLGTDKGMYHQAWDHGWWPSVSGWEALGGRFDSPPAVTA